MRCTEHVEVSHPRRCLSERLRGHRSRSVKVFRRPVRSCRAIYLITLETSAIGQAKAAIPMRAAFHQGILSSVCVFANIDKNGIIYLCILLAIVSQPLKIVELLLILSFDKRQILLHL
jgi:hypothetical protein